MATMVTTGVDYDVAIIGAGLVGATLAALIASKPENSALKIGVIDRGSVPQLPDLSQNPPTFDSRVVALTPQSKQLLMSIGAWPSIENRRSCAYQHMRVWDDEGTGSIEFHADELRQTELGTIVESSIALDGVLQQLETTSQVELLRGQGLSNLTHRNNAVEITLESGQKISTSLVVAADGALSRVRDLMAMPVREWAYGQQALVATVKTEKHHQNTAWQNFRTSGPLAFLPLSGGVGSANEGQYCSVVWSVDMEESKPLLELTNEAFADNLARAFNHQLGQVLLVEQRQSIPLIQRHAINYFADQVVLVGDAAHTIHPLAGQGVNLGLLDAKVLAEEITRAHRRGLPLAEPSLLRRYQRQRKPNNMQMMLLMEGFKRLFGDSHLQVRWMRNQGLSSMNKMKPMKNWLAKQAMGI